MSMLSVKLVNIKADMVAYSKQKRSMRKCCILKACTRSTRRKTMNVHSDISAITKHNVNVIFISEGRLI
jgi:hypothetical protein